MPRLKKVLDWRDYEGISEIRRGTTVFYRARLNFPADPMTGKRAESKPRDFYGKTPAIADAKRAAYLPGADLTVTLCDYIINEFLPSEKKKVRDGNLKSTTYFKRESQATSYIARPDPRFLPNTVRTGFHQLKLGELTPEHSRAYVNALRADGVSAWCLVGIKAHLSRALQEAEGRLRHQHSQYFDFVAWQIKTPPRKKKDLPNDIDAFMRHLAACINNESFRLSDRALVAFQLWCFCRPSEAYALEWTDIDFSRKVARLEKAVRPSLDGGWAPDSDTKNGYRSNREARLPTRLVELLQELKEQSQTSYVFAADNGAQLYRGLNKHIWNRIRSEWELPSKMAFYHLKTVGVSWTQANGANPSVIAAACGHASPRMVMQTYREVMPREREGVANMFDNVKSLVS